MSRENIRVLKKKVFISSKIFSWSSKLLSFISFHKHHKRYVGTIFHTTSIHVDYMSRHNPRQTKMTEEVNPNGISHITVKKKIVYGLPVFLTHVISVHHNDVSLFEDIHGKNLT